MDSKILLRKETKSPIREIFWRNEWWLIMAFMSYFNFGQFLMAQISEGGIPTSFTETVSQNIHTVVMPPVDVEVLIAQDAMEIEELVPPGLAILSM